MFILKYFKISNLFLITFFVQFIICVDRNEYIYHKFFCFDDLTQDLTIDCKNGCGYKFTKDYYYIHSIRFQNCHFPRSRQSFSTMFGGIISKFNFPTLNMSAVGLETLTEEDFSDDIEFNELILSNNNITHLDEQLFRKMERLRTLDLSFNPLSTLDYEVFPADQQNYLSTLNLAHTNLSNIGNDFLLSLENVQQLDVSHNNIIGSNMPSFGKMKQLETLDLSFNSLNKIDRRDFDGPNNLRTLNLAHTNLTDLSDGSFSKLFNLHTLDISHNNIRNLYIDSFGKMKKLQSLDLSFNPLNKLNDGIFNELNNLQTLILSHTNLSDISNDFFLTLKYLYMLDISSNNIMYLNEHSIGKMKNLRSLDLSFNPLYKLNDRVFNGIDNLHMLNLSHTNFVYFDFDTLSPLTNLITLDISYSQIKRIIVGSHLAMFLHLAQLHLNDNKIDEIIGLSSIKFPNLIELDVRGNLFNCSHLKSILNDFIYVKRFTTLKLHSDPSSKIKVNKSFHGIACIPVQIESMPTVNSIKSMPCNDSYRFFDSNTFLMIIIIIAIAVGYILYKNQERISTIFNRRKSSIHVRQSFLKENEENELIGI